MTPLRERIQQLSQRSESVQSKIHQKVARQIAERKLTRGVLIDVGFGGQAESILNQTQVETLYGIDHYEYQENCDDPLNLSQVEKDEEYQFVLDRLKGFGERYCHLRCHSEQAIDQIEGSIDFLILDGLLSRDSVWKNLCRWFSRVQDYGIIGGCQYGEAKHSGVKEAVDRFFRRFDWKIQEGREGVWWVEKKPLPISFFIPAYNCAATIEESVESIMATNFTPGDELVMVNDGSIDETAEVLAKLEKKHSQIRVVNHPFNKGGSSARNTAVENAKNNLLFCLDSDNILAENSIVPLKRYLIETGADAAGFEEMRIFKNNPYEEEITRWWRFKRGWTTPADCLASPYVLVASGNYMFTKESWCRASGYPVFAGAYDAWGFGFYQVATGSAMTVLPDSHYFHRVGHDSYMVRQERKGNKSLIILQIILPFIHLINEKDLNYIMGTKGRYKWFQNIQNRPIRFITGEKGRGGSYETTQRPPSKIVQIAVKIFGMVRSLKERIENNE